ncbi:MAG: hypothetical protein IJS14_08150 [Lentisphaeria bacterium]|nr:hypothetical protein [Lentisphaeria bacterium]
MLLFFAIAALGFFAFIANLLPVIGNIIVGFFKYVALPIIIIVAIMCCFAN